MITIPDNIKDLFNVLAEGILIIDDESKVVFANKSYLNFINMTEEETLGRKLRDFRPHAQLPNVVSTGVAVLHAQRLEGLEEAYFVNMYPLKNERGIIGGISVVTFMSEAEKARSELEKYEQRVRQQVIRQANKNAAVYTFEDIVAVSPMSQGVKNFAQKAAETEMSVLLNGESGTGKELYAQAIHNASNRKKNVFLAVNCANFNSNMLDSELFGYVEGAFTGAKKGGKIGLFEAAKGGTLFLDEVSEMDITLQAKLLRAIQERKIRPVGGLTERNVDVRIICASNADLEKRVYEGSFRKDLYYRLNTFTVSIPPLRERREDIPALAIDVINDMSHKLRKKISISEEAMECLKRHSWPGNVRELRNVIEFSAYMCEDDTIVLGSLPTNLVASVANISDEKLSERVKIFEKNEIEKLILRYGNTLEGKKKTAEILGISLATLYNKLNQKIF